MIPFSSASQYRAELLELVLLLRSGSEEPLYALTVAEPGEDIDARIAESEEALEQLERYTAGAAVPVETRTKVKRHVATGIVEALLENRITMLVMDWDGARTRRQFVFGHIIDRVLARTHQLVVLAHVRGSIGATREVVLVLPRDVHHGDGFPAAVHHTKRIADHVGADVRAFTLADGSASPEPIVRRIEPHVPLEFEYVRGWDALSDRMGNHADSTLVVAISARRGTAGWHGTLEALPGHVSGLTDGDFVILYPATDERPDDRRFLRYR